MRHLKKSALLAVTTFVIVAVVFAFLEGFARVLIFPIAAFAIFAALYLMKQGQKDAEENIKDGVRYTVEDMEAEQWIKHDLAPRTFSYIKQKHWPIIIYGFLFVIGVAYLWSYLTAGESGVLQHTLYAAILFCIFAIYSLASPWLFNMLYKCIPKQYRKRARNDWLRGFIFLLPLTSVAYVMSPFIGTGTVTDRLAGLPGFLLGYTLLFLCAYSIVYLYLETKKEEAKELKKSVKEYLKE